MCRQELGIGVGSGVACLEVNVGLGKLIKFSDKEVWVGERVEV